MPRVVLQDLANGHTFLGEVPRPSVSGASVLVGTLASVVSAGTERMLVDFGRASFIGKVRSQPQRVSEVLNKARTDGVGATIGAVRSKLAQPIPLGYSSAGVVLEVGGGVSEVAVGDLVAAAGPHAELASVPANLVVRVPRGVAPADAAFSTIGSVALQGLRLAAPTVGERFVVTGLGLVGLITVQLLVAQSCSVLGIDPNPDRRARAEAYGALTVDSAHDVLSAASDLTRGMGVDGVVVCASTSSSEPLRQAAQMCRQRGRIVLVGVTGLELDRSDFYEKELTFQVSASYGPGRYDPSYMNLGVDYPAGFVRWTAGRNMEAVLGLVSSRRLDVASLVTHGYRFDNAPDAYETLVSDPSALGIALRYREPDPAHESPLVQRRINIGSSSRPAHGAGIGLLGAGNFATQVLLPAIVAAGGDVRTIVSSGGISASLAARKFGAGHASSNPLDVISDPLIDTVVIATRHDSHARYVEQALRAGKNAFVEKPLAITWAQLNSVRTCIEELAAQGSVPLLGVGYNRRFAPITLRMAELLATQRGPKAMTLTMNAGAIPSDHWTQNLDVGGGRIVGEACHMIDLARFLVGTPIADARTIVMGGNGPRDTASIALDFEDGSIATVNYFANGTKRYPKERIEVFSGGKVLVNENFRTMRAYGWRGVRTLRLRSQDKGHQAGIAAFLNAIRGGGEAPIPLGQILEISEISLRAADID